MIGVSDDSHLWAEQYDRELVDVFAVQSEIAEQVAVELGVTLLDSERRVMRERPTDNLEAYQSFIRGRWLAAQPHFTFALWPKMMESFERAVELDPDFSLAHAEIARSHAELRYYAYDFSSERLDLATNAAQRAIALAPLDPRVHLALAQFYLLAHRDTESAAIEIDIARRSLGETNAEVLKAEIFVRELEGRFEEALDLADEAMRQDPLDPYVPSEAIFDSWGVRDYPRAFATRTRPSNSHPSPSGRSSARRGCTGAGMGISSHRGLPSRGWRRTAMRGSNGRGTGRRCSRAASRTRCVGSMPTTGLAEN